MKQIHRLFVIDAEAVPVCRAVWRERIVHLHLRQLAQTLLSARQFNRIDIGCKQPTAGQQTRQYCLRMAAKAQRSIECYLAGLRI